jgi:hypothetical protein
MMDTTPYFDQRYIGSSPMELGERIVLRQIGCGDGAVFSMANNRTVLLENGDKANQSSDPKQIAREDAELLVGESLP